MQIVIVMEFLFEGGDLFNWVFEYYEVWGIGGSWEKSNGVFIYVVCDDCKVCIMMGYGVEGFLLDVFVKWIIDEIIMFNFWEGCYYCGFDWVISVIMELVQGEYINDNLQQVNGK